MGVDDIRVHEIVRLNVAGVDEVGVAAFDGDEERSVPTRGVRPHRRKDF